MRIYNTFKEVTGKDCWWIEQLEVFLCEILLQFDESHSSQEIKNAQEGFRVGKEKTYPTLKSFGFNQEHLKGNRLEKIPLKISSRLSTACSSIPGIQEELGSDKIKISIRKDSSFPLKL